MKELRLNSFLGVEFGSSKEHIKEKLLNREGADFDNVNSTDDVLFFTGISFAGRQTTLIMLLLVNDKFCKSSVFIKPKLDAHIVAIYNEIKSELNSKYFITDLDYEIYDEPYERNDGYTESGISIAKINFSCYWKFIDEQGGKEDFISLRISEDLEIVINYEDGDLINELTTQVKNINSEDY